MLNHSQFAQLMPIFLTEHAANRPVVLATLIATEGSSYRKAGAQMLFTQDGRHIGLLSGGCLESDLQEHATRVMADRFPRIVRYDLRQPEDEIFGLGSGCTGAMNIFLQLVDSANHWQPLACLYKHWEHQSDTRIGIITRSNNNDLPTGSMVLNHEQLISPLGQIRAVSKHLQNALDTTNINQLHEIDTGSELFLLVANAPPHLLILGGGADVIPLTQQADLLNWRYTVYDHRPHYADPIRFPKAAKVIAAPADQLAQRLMLDRYQAAVVMSHHLSSDLSYLKQLSNTHIAYLGLLGPAARREKLFAAMPNEMPLLLPRLHAPIGLPIHAETPEAIALSIIAEIYQTFASNSR